MNKIIIPKRYVGDVGSRGILIYAEPLALYWSFEFSYRDRSEFKYTAHLFGRSATLVNIIRRRK